MSEVTQEAHDALQQQLEAAQEANEQLRVDLLARDIGVFVGECLVEVGTAFTLPTLEALAAQLVGKAVVKDGQLDRVATKLAVETAVQAKTAELASYSQEGLGLGETVTGNEGGNNVPKLEISQERLVIDAPADGRNQDFPKRTD